ncbi:calcium-activated chloride channel regulator 1-like [Tropilaelaps mercedesae]|uniref:Calcium-activated chloride channel regulator 1-like n=1 Tax=Tropilaelaps mercedesae TaxID=418985 RepID=A0A1V9XZR2_9ACAR|nr:calcium-activated chloride channel regulator 1-like [Tropilaelaps mercedesae]
MLPSRLVSSQPASADGSLALLAGVGGNSAALEGAAAIGSSYFAAKPLGTSSRLLFAFPLLLEENVWVGAASRQPSFRALVPVRLLASSSFLLSEAMLLNGNGAPCNATINVMNGLPLDQDCIPVFSAERGTTEASIMSGVPSATQFCGGAQPHDRSLPTKQNVMCGERSTGEIIERHPDFLERAHNGLLGRTRFVFVQERAQVVAFVVQITDSTMQHNRRNYILRALNQFLRSEAPNDMQIALVTYGAVASEIALRRALASDEGVRNAVDALLLLNAEMDSENHVNSTLEDGLHAALAALNDTSEITERVAHNAFTKRVLIIGDGYSSETFSDHLHHSYNIQGVRVDAIIFPSRSRMSLSTSTVNDDKYELMANAVSKAAGVTAISTSKSSVPPSRLSVNLDGMLDEFVSRTGGRVMSVNDTPIDNSVTVAALQELYDALYAFTYTGTSAAQYDSFSQIEQKEFHGKEQNEMVFEFNVDATLNSELRVRLIGHDYGSDRPWTVSPKDISLFAPTAHTANGKKVYSPKDYKFVSTSAQFWYYEFKIPEPAVGCWRLEAKTRKDTKQPIIVSASAKPTTKENDEPIVVDVWTSQPSHNVSLRERGLVVYAKVSKASRPVVDVNVVAKITLVSDQTEAELCTELKDNGAGDPDITKDDGIYSRYIEGIRKIGRHRLVVEAKSEGNAAVLQSLDVPDDRIPHTACCGSAIVRTIQKATGPFARRVQFGSFFVTDVANGYHDSGLRQPWAVPGRIADLHVVYLQSNQEGPGGVSLRWTATGNVRDHGRASSYILKRFSSRDEAAAQFDESGQEISDWEVEDGSLSPKEPGKSEQIFFKLASNLPLPQYFALKVNNTYGALSAVSNIVTVSVMPSVTASISSIWKLGGSPRQGGSGPSGSMTVGNVPFSSGQGTFNQRNATRLVPSQLALIVTVPLIVLALGVSIVIIIVARRRKDPLLDKVKNASINEKSNGDTYQSGRISKNSQGTNKSPVLTPSSLVKEGLSPMTGMALSASLGLDGTTVAVEHTSSMGDPNSMPMIMSQMAQQQVDISPVNHWPAEVLLEHYNKAQEAKQRNEQPSMLTLQQQQLDESPQQSSGGLYSTLDSFRSRSPHINNSATSNHMNGSLQHLSVNMSNGAYPLYYDSCSPIVTPTGIHVNSSRNITHV